MKLMKTLGLAALLACAANASLAHVDTEGVRRGAYLARVSDCIACHSAPGGKENAGGLPMDTPVGKIYSTNITPDKETGIGSWTSEQIIAAIRTGKKPDGGQLSGVMPYLAFSHLSDEDAQAIAAFLMSIPAVNHKNEGPIKSGEPVTINVSAVLPPAIYNALPASQR